MKPRAKIEFLVGYDSRNIYRILLLDEEVVIGTRDVMFDENIFLSNHKELTVKDESIPVIDFTMIPSIPDIVHDIDDVSIRNNEPDSQRNDGEKSLTPERIRENSSNNETSTSPKNLALTPQDDWCGVDQRNILVDLHSRNKT